MNERTKLFLVFFTLGPTVLATRLKDESTRLDIFNMASYPVIIREQSRYQMEKPMVENLAK